MTSSRSRPSSSNFEKLVVEGSLAIVFICRLFWLLQAAVLARIAAGVIGATGGEYADTLIVLAALAWAAVCVSWALRHVWWYGTPRIDGRSG